jgi:1,5-anhydro-D-fructose reductase (1,5-anhydro-D-mannitol-forming)
MQVINGPVRWGIIGCGDVCEVKSGPAFNKVPDSSLVAVMRRDAQKAEDYARRHKVPRFYTDASSLINDPEVNAVYIATPPGSHEAYAIESMRAGKPVYIEKPVALNSAECRRMISASSDLRVPATVAHYRRRLEIFERVKSLVDQNNLGAPRLLILHLFHTHKPASAAGPGDNWRIKPELSGGGLFSDLSPHQLDIIFWIFGPPIKITGVSINQGRHYNAPDVTSLTAVFKNDILFQGLWSFNSPTQANADFCKIICENGTLVFPFFSSFSKVKLEIHRGDTSEEEFAFPEHIQQPMIEQVVKYFQGNATNPCSLEDALVSMQMIEQGYNS